MEWDVLLGGVRVVQVWGGFTLCLGSGGTGDGATVTEASLATAEGGRRECKIEQALGLLRGQVWTSVQGC